MVYDEKVKPTEIRHLYSQFDTPPIRDAELFGKPTIMLLGQYSVGKTSMIAYLLNGTYPGADIGPEPTTDIFAHISYSEFPIIIPGTTLVADKDYQFQTLDMFGDVFLNKLRATNFKADLLKHISIIDTPGILTGDKQVAARGYDFSKIIKFLSNKVDLIFLLFDANKLDISDEYKQVIEILDGCDDKIRIVLNKADSVRPRELVRVRGALMWALGKIMKCPEVPKVYIGSFWPYWNEKNALLRGAIQEDLDALIKDILNLPSDYHAKRVNDVIRRARNLRLHSYIMDEVMKSSMFFKSTKNSADSQTEPTKLVGIYHNVARQRRIVLNDFPDPLIFHEKAKATDPKQWNRLDPKLDKMLNEFLEHDVAPIVTAAINEARIVIDYKPPKKVPLPKDYNELKKISDERPNEKNANKKDDKEKEKKVSKNEGTDEKDAASGDAKKGNSMGKQDNKGKKKDEEKECKKGDSKKDDEQPKGSPNKKNNKEEEETPKKQSKPTAKEGDIGGKDEGKKENSDEKASEKEEKKEKSKSNDEEKESERKSKDAKNENKSTKASNKSNNNNKDIKSDKAKSKKSEAKSEKNGAKENSVPSEENAEKKSAAEDENKSKQAGDNSS
uniref:Dynamin-type G domain-containing protein n=1 Tax=Ascaris lumbricoides TaxID=6252 RepID=A0A0M3IE34_ASCLU